MDRKSEKTKKLANRVMVRIIPATVLTIILIVVLVIFCTRKIVGMTADESLTQESQKDAYYISQLIVEAESGMSSAIDTVVSSGITDNGQVSNALTPTMSLSDLSTSGVYIGMEDGSWLDPSGWKPDSDYVITDRDWYKLGIKSDTFVLGEPYVDAKTGGLVVTMSRKVTLADGRVGVAACDLKLDSIVSYVSKLKPMKNGGAMLLAGDDILSYFHDDLNGKKISEADDEYLTKVKSVMDSSPSGVRSIKSYNGTTYECVFTNVDGTDWTLISSVDKGTVYAEVNRVSALADIVSVAGILMISIILFMIIKKMVSEPVIALTSDIKKIAGGDFTVKVAEGGEDEIGQMNGAMGRFVKGMHDTLTNMSSETGQLVKSAETSQSDSEVLNEQAERQSESMEQISEAMNGMAQAVTELAENATNLAEEVNSLSEQGIETDNTVTDLLEKAGNGQRALSGVETEMGTLSKAMADIDDAVDKVGKSAGKITDIVGMIDSIAKQTNLLSLNASIEAARAGEAGKGFAVVATEIGKLANDSSEAANQIADIISEVTEKIQILAEQSSENMINIKNGTETVNNATETFKEIFSSLDATGNTVKGMIERVGKVNDIASSVAAIAEEQSASTEEVTATVDSIVATAQKVAESSGSVSSSAQKVNDSAENIENMIERFTL